MGDKYNIIFLDTNGVLNYSLHRQRLLKSRKSVDYKSMELCKVALSNLARLCNETNSKVVITSSWRRNKEKGYFKNLVDQLTNIGSIDILGETPILDYDVEKGIEIDKWFSDNKHIEYNKYIVIDDKEIEGYISNEVICDRDLGFTTNELYKEAYEKLMA